MERPAWDEYFLGIATAVSKRADCSRRSVGAVVVDIERRIVSTGYNGSFPGGPSCLKGQCPRGKHFLIRKIARYTYETGADYTVHCVCGGDWPCTNSVEPGSSYDTGPGACVAVHAELNAILFADRNRLTNAVLYITDKPCDGCAKHIRSTHIARVVWPGGEYDNG